MLQCCIEEEPEIRSGILVKTILGAKPSGQLLEVEWPQGRSLV